MNLPTPPSIKNIILLIALSSACVALAGCGNKGPLVKPSDIPAATPVGAEPAATPAVVPDTAPDTAPATAPASEPAAGTPAARR